jgi:hypothetical protein
MTALLTLFILLDTAHRLSPLVLSWSHDGLRQLMLSYPRKFIVPPAAAFLAGAAISIATGLGLTSYVPGPGRIHHFTNWGNPLPVMVGVYFLLNFWHFGMQNYGVLRLCGCAGNGYWKLLAFAVTAIGFKLSFPIIYVHHWLTDIGLSARLFGRSWWIFVASLLFISPIAFVYQMPPWLAPEIDEQVFRSANNLWMVMLIGLAFSVSFAHFSVSARIWKLSDRQVRAAIGKELFA